MVKRHSRDGEDAAAGRQDEVAEAEAPRQSCQFGVQNTNKNAGLVLVEKWNRSLLRVLYEYVPAACGTG
jgi:hypothetical protein